eukprot:CFRG6019T1
MVSSVSTTGLNDSTVASSHTTLNKRSPTHKRSSLGKPISRHLSRRDNDTSTSNLRLAVLKQLNVLQRGIIDSNKYNRTEGIVRYPGVSMVPQAISNTWTNTSDTVGIPGSLSNYSSMGSFSSATEGSDVSRRASQSTFADEDSFDGHGSDPLHPDSESHFDHLDDDCFSEDDHVCSDDPDGCDCSLDLEDALITIMADGCSL